MAFRGRGRGRGGNFGGGSFAKEEKFEVFPKIENLPKTPKVDLNNTGFTNLVKLGDDLHKFWTTSPYYLEPVGQDAERNGGIRKASLSDFIKMTDDYVPAELVSRNVRHSNKKVRWDAQSDLHKLDIFEKLDRESQGQDGGEKKEDEDEDPDNENIEEEEEESGDDDYAKNIDFDDDDDDYNQNDDGGDEGFF